LAHLLEIYDAPRVLDYLSLDVEGAETISMSGFPFDWYRFRILTIDRPSAILQTKLVGQGYLFLKDISGFGESLWVHKQEIPSLHLEWLGLGQIY
jgi:hypothetical protein